MAKDLYAILGVPKDATADAIKKAYRRLARELHPDRNPEDPHAEEHFKEVQGAYAVLNDESKRGLYDEFGPDGLREGFDARTARNYAKWAGGGMGGMGGGIPFNFGGGGGGVNLGGFGNLDDLLSGLFGGGGGRVARRQPRRGQDVEAEVTVSLREAVDGTEVELDGRGKLRIPAGIGDAQRMRVGGQGSHGPAGRGDLYLTVRVATPAGFERDDDDLTLNVPVTVSQAVLGGSVELPTPTGGNARLRIPAGAQSGQRLRLRGHGMTRKGGRGHLYARVMVRVPTGDADALRAAVEALDPFYEGVPVEA